MVPINLLGGAKQADYVHTGEWAKKAIGEAKKFCQVHLAASSADRAFSYAPKQSSWSLSREAAYVHYTGNETIGGVEFHWVPETGAIPLVADLSSTLLSRPLEVSKFGLIYAGAQKNIGPAGLTLVIVREDLLGRAPAHTAAMLDYKVQAEHGSMYNTPPTYALYVAGLVLQWLKRIGGLKEMERRNVAKAKLVYDVVDASGFYRNPVVPDDRSRMNVPFTLADAALDEIFLEQAGQQGLVQLKGHRSVGGMRASIYNAMPIEGVQALAQFMREFERRHG
jgi:phosphoserine aminotransferase